MNQANQYPVKPNFAPYPNNQQPYYVGTKNNPGLPITNNKQQQQWIHSSSQNPTVFPDSSRVYYNNNNSHNHRPFPHQQHAFYVVSDNPQANYTNNNHHYYSGNQYLNAANYRSAVIQPSTMYPQNQPIQSSHYNVDPMFKPNAKLEQKQQIVMNHNYHHPSNGQSYPPNNAIRGMKPVMYPSPMVTNDKPYLFPVSQQNFTTNNNNFRNDIKKSNENIHLRQILGFTKEEICEDIVEKTRPIFKKIKRLNPPAVDVKKLMLSLKSGLLAEATWALDCLNMLSSNESFKIQSVPNILTTLVEYYKASLNELFEDLFIDTESDYQSKLMQKLSKFPVDNDSVECKEMKKLVGNDDRIVLLDSTNYTFKSRNGIPVKVKNEEFNSKKLVEYSHLEELCDYQYFQNGNTFSSAYIVSNIDPKNELVSFLKNNGDDNDDVPTKISLKRKIETDTEAEQYDINTVLCPRREYLENLIKRCLCISTIIRNLSFLSENSRIMAKHPALILVLARLLLFQHRHLEKKSFAMVLKELEERTFQKENQEAREMFREPSFETLHTIRMNTFVTMSNLSEHLDLTDFNDNIILPFLDGLLHWSVCQSSYAQDGFPPDNLSCRMQALEIITKLSINDSNMDLILATPPFERIENFFKVLVELIGREEDQVCRELSSIILSNISRCDVLSARIILHLKNSVSNLLTFIEQCEHAQRIQGLPVFPVKNNNEMFTITYILKHAAGTIRTMATNCEVQDLYRLKKYEERFVNLTMSNYFDPEVTQILADLVFILTNRMSSSLK